MQFMLIQLLPKTFLLYSLTLIHWNLEKELTKIDCMFCKVPRFYPFLVVMIMNEWMHFINVSNGI